MQEMHTLGISKFDVPGDLGFPLNSVYAKPADASEAGNLSILCFPTLLFHEKCVL